ncbi:hypothetical protein BRC2024_OQYPJBKP_CDS_0076 [Acinetobacter phage vB_AbaM_Highwayman]
MTNPTLITIPFAENGDKNIIPESVGTNPQNATMQAGFPPITQQKISEGGIPPERNDFNGILNLYGQHIVHLNKGLPYEFDQAFADAIGGYPLNARLMLNNGDIVKSTVPNNVTNPNLDMAGWVKVNSASQIIESSGLTQQQFNDVITNKEIYLSRLGAKFDGSDETAILQRAVDMADELTTIVFDKTGFKFSSVNYGTKSVSMRGVFTNNPRRIPIVVYITGAGIVGSGQVIRLDSLDFRSTGNKGDGANITLMDNPHKNGTFLSVTNCAARNFSGVVFGFKDLIDSKISGFIPERNNIVFKFTLGDWVASTTITLEKIYAQQNTLLFDADDCDHCTMIDCIFEYNTSLGHINSGSWTVINYYGEGNSAPLVATNTNLTILKQYTLSGANDGFLNTFTTRDPFSVGSTLISGRQLSAFDFRKDYETYRTINPSFGSDTWTKIGNMRLETAGSCVITIIGANEYGTTTGAATEGDSRSVIICHKRSAGSGIPGIAATWHTIGNAPPISDVRIVDTQTSAGLEVYVLQKAYGYMGVAVDVFKAELFKYDIKTSQPKPTGGGSGDVNTPTMYIVPQYVKISAGTAYVGSDGTNPLLGGSTATTIGAAGSAAALPANPLGYIVVSINGTPRKIPYYNI